MGKFLIILLVILLTLYPIVELTRVIVISEIILRVHPEIPQSQFITELVVMWLFYLGIIPILVWRLKKEE